MFAAAGALACAEDARDIVRRSVESDTRNDEIARNYTFLQRVEERQLDAGGKVKRVSARTYDITLLEGSPYRRLVARDDKPLSPEEQRKEDEKLRKSNEQRRRETPEERDRRIREWNARRARDREQVREIPDAFDFRILREEVVDGRPAYVIGATPRPGYRGKSRIGKLLPKFTGTLWIDKQDYSWTKAEAEAIDTLSFGLFLARIQKGMRVSFEQARVNGEVWLPKRVEFGGAARLALVKSLRMQVSVRFSNYRKFQTETRILPATP